MIERSPDRPATLTGANGDARPNDESVAKVFLENEIVVAGAAKDNLPRSIDGLSSACQDDGRTRAGVESNRAIKHRPVAKKKLVVVAEIQWNIEVGMIEDAAS